ncbi:MAG: nitronate monooxygenase family protein [Candidatus Hydrogenedentota bacterium]
MEIPKLRIGTLTADVPIIQGGMGVKVSLSSLASAVANAGGIGTIASVGIGDIRTTRHNYETVSNEAMAEEIRKARKNASGPIAVNVMSVLSNAEALIRTCVDEGVKMIVVGAGLPLKLPAMVEDTTVNLVPIVSSARAAKLILRTWQKRYARTAQAVIVEGPLAGGHLGFSEAELAHPGDFALERLVPEVIEALKPFEDAFGVNIPVIAAGGIYTGHDIARMLSLGAAGVQMATRFVCTTECAVSDAFKQAYLDASEDDIVIIKSPVGIPGRAIKNRFLERLDAGEPIPIDCPYKCLSTCKIYDSRYCIAHALLNAYDGDMNGGLVFAGQNVHRIREIVSVKELMAGLLDELRAA